MRKIVNTQARGARKIRRRAVLDSKIAHHSFLPEFFSSLLGLVSDARCDGHHEMADSRCDGHHKMVDSGVGAAMANSCQHNRAMTAVRIHRYFCVLDGLTRISRRRCSGSSVLSGCWTARSDLGWRWLSRLVATTSEDRPNISPTN